MNHPVNPEDKRKMRRAEMQALVDACEFKPWSLVLRYHDVDRQYPYVQVRCVDGTDNDTGEKASWGGRKWTLSYHMTDTEIVNTVWLAVVQATMHETAENFKVNGVALNNPHVDYHVRRGAVVSGYLDVRVNAMEGQ